MSVFDEENLYLEKVQKIIDEEIKKLKDELNKLIINGQTLSYEDRMRGEHFHINSRAIMDNEQIEILNRSKDVPYFGKMNVSFYDKSCKNDSIYIGKYGILANGKQIITDWRSPIGSIYYDNEIGKLSYDSPNGKECVNLISKRQINIKNGKLLSVQDSNLVSNDDLLKPYLEMNADNKMKTIIASIQKEQNEIIRMPEKINMIVQGVAGSGKTSVALHRISYLLYNLKDELSSNSFLVLGPNDYFLNYISSVLPELETSSVNEETYFNYARKYINEKINMKKEMESEKVDFNKKIQSFKTSLEYRDLLDDFMKNYISQNIIPSDFKILDEVVFTKEQMREYLFSLNPSIPNYNKLLLMLENSIKNYSNIYDNLNEKYRKQYTKMDYNDPNRKKIIEYTNKLYDLLKNSGVKLVKKFVKDIQLSTLEIYALFIEYLYNIDTSLSEKDILLLQKNTLLDIKKKTLGFEDIPALIYIYYKLSNKTNDYKQIVIDEAQDYGLFHFDVLKKTNPNAYFTIYGDLAQAIYSYRSINDWNEVNNKIFDSNAEMLLLSKSYRTTTEITNNANKILSYLNLKEAVPVIRHGAEVMTYSNCVDSNFKINKINEMIDKGYKTVAVICKDEKEVKQVFKELENSNIDAKIISPNDVNYDGGLFVLTAASSKGLEFDGVIINDVSDSTYDINSNVDMHLLYVACTRSLHELNLINKGKIISLFETNSIISVEREKKLLKEKHKI